MFNFMNTAIWMYPKPIDFRKQLYGLMMMVTDTLGKDPVKDGVCIFRNKRSDRIKVLVWDRDGFWMCYKILEKGQFSFPCANQDILHVSSEQFQWLLTGLAYRPVVEKNFQPSHFY